MKPFKRKLFQETPKIDEPVEDVQEEIEDVIENVPTLPDPEAKSLYKRKLNFKDKIYA